MKDTGKSIITREITDLPLPCCQVSPLSLILAHIFPSRFKQLLQHCCFIVIVISYSCSDGASRRKNATRETTSTLKAWLQEHQKNPYPTKGEKIMLAIITRMTLTQVGFQHYLSCQRNPSFCNSFERCGLLFFCYPIMPRIESYHPDLQFFAHSGLDLVCKRTKEAEKRKQGDVVAARLQKLRRPSLRRRRRRRRRRGGEATQI